MGTYDFFSSIKILDRFLSSFGILKNQTSRHTYICWMKKCINISTFADLAEIAEDNNCDCCNLLCM